MNEQREGLSASAAELLYVSYDGMTDPLGRSQVLPYLTGLASRGHRITLLSLDKPALHRRHCSTVDRICRAAGIKWHSLAYRHRPPIVSAIVNIAALTRAAKRLHRERGFDFLHCRSDLAGIAGMAVKRHYHVPMLYDMRALWPDERAEGGAWDQRKPLYRAIFRYFKARQRELLDAADHIVTLSDAGRQVLLAMPESPSRAPVTVIPCCADFDQFTLPQAATRSRRRIELGLGPSDRLMIHLGSIGCNSLLDEMLDFMLVYRGRHPSSRLLFLTPDDNSTIMAASTSRGIEDQIDVRSANREEVPGWIGAADLGLFFVRPVFSKKAASPTKLGEMLAVGLPVVTNDGVGDVAAIIGDVGAGVVIDRFDETAYREAIDRLGSRIFKPEQIRANSLPWFDVRLGIDRYDAIYRRLAELGEACPKPAAPSLAPASAVRRAPAP